MEKLTKKQRHEIYKKAHNLIKENNETYLCNTLGRLTDNYFNSLLDIGCEIDFFIPIGYNSSATALGGYFEWDNYSEVKELRLTILEFCIEMSK